MFAALGLGCIHFRLPLRKKNSGLVGRFFLQTKQTQFLFPPLLRWVLIVALAWAGALCVTLPASVIMPS